MPSLVQRVMDETRRASTGDSDNTQSKIGRDKSPCSGRTTMLSGYGTWEKSTSLLNRQCRLLEYGPAMPMLVLYYSASSRCATLSLVKSVSCAVQFPLTLHFSLHLHLYVPCRATLLARVRQTRASEKNSPGHVQRHATACQRLGPQLSLGSSHAPQELISAPCVD